VAAVSGYTGRARGEVKTLPGIPQTNLPLTSTAVLDRPSDIREKTTHCDKTFCYLERIDKRQKVEAKSFLRSVLTMCGSLAILGQDEDEERMAKRLYCGKQWHAACREITHNRKIARVLPRAQQVMPMGYWVVRPPWELMPLLRTKKSRSSFAKKVKDAFRAVGYARGLTFIHDFGEHSIKYALHLNVLVDGEYIPDERLDDLKRKLRRLIYPRSVIRKWGDKLDINYHYRRSRAEIMHTLKYCTKATFLDLEWDESLAVALYGARYSNWWGNWKQEPKWQLAASDKETAALSMLEQGLHPVSGKPIKWSKKPVPWALVLTEDPVPLGNGYYLLPPIRPPPPPAQACAPPGCEKQT